MADQLHTYMCHIFSFSGPRFLNSHVVRTTLFLHIVSTFSFSHMTAFPDTLQRIMRSLHATDSLLWTECLCPPKVHMVKLWSPNVIIYGSRAFERELGLDEVMMMGLTWWDLCCYKRRKRPELTLFASAHKEVIWSQRERGTAYKSRKEASE